MGEKEVTALADKTQEQGQGQLRDLLRATTGAVEVKGEQTGRFRYSYSASGLYKTEWCFLSEL